MSLFIFDTDILTLVREDDPHVAQQAAAHPADTIVCTVISVEEILSGWYTYLRQAKLPPQVAEAYRELASSVEFLREWTLLLFTESAIARYKQLLALKLNVGRMDLRIAAIALEYGGTVVTRNVRAFQRVPGLQVENWAV